MKDIIKYGAVGFLIGLIISLIHKYPSFINSILGVFGISFNPISDFVFYITPFLGLVAGLVAWYVVEGEE